MTVLAIVPLACVLVLFAYERHQWAKEREKLIKRLISPQQVVVEERPKRPKVEPVSMNDDAAFKRRREARAS